MTSVKLKNGLLLVLVENASAHAFVSTSGDEARRIAANIAAQENLGSQGINECECVLALIGAQATATVGKAFRISSVDNFLRVVGT